MLNNINNFYVIIFLIGITLYLYNRENFSWWSSKPLTTSSANPPLNRFTNPPINLSTNPFLNQIINQPNNPFLIPSLNQFINPVTNPVINNAESQIACMNRVVKEPNQWDFETNNKCDLKTKKRIELSCIGNTLPNVKYSSMPMIKKVICPRAGSTIVDKYNKQKRGGIADEATYYVNNNMNTSVRLYLKSM